MDKEQHELAAEIQRGTLCATTSVLSFLVGHLTVNTPTSEQSALHAALLEFRQVGLEDQGLGLAGEEAYNHIYDMVEGTMTSIIDRKQKR